MVLEIIGPGPDLWAGAWLHPNLEVHPMDLIRRVGNSNRFGVPDFSPRPGAKSALPGILRMPSYDHLDLTRRAVLALRSSTVPSCVLDPRQFAWDFRQGPEVPPKEARRLTGAAGISWMAHLSYRQM